MTILGTKQLGEDLETGLQKELRIWQITIDGKSEVILVVYDIVLISPKGGVVKVINTNSFRRFNRPAIIEDGVEVKPENNKFDALKLSPLGQGILGMLQVDINNIQGFDTLEQDLEQL